jgi:photosystem II stability/assembly factor-like uncharacterized protein
MFFSKLWKTRQSPWCLFVDKRPQRRRIPQQPSLFLEPLEDRTLLTAWTALGPAPLTGSVQAGHTLSGRISGIAADPGNANIVYVATAGGGVWKTTNAQDVNPKWTPLTDNIPGITDSMGAIAIASSNTNILYAGTGESTNAQYRNYGDGILVSTDGGSSWTLENPGGMFTGLTVSKIVVDPTNADIAYAAVSNSGWNKRGILGTGIYKTSDGGATWTNTTTSITTGQHFDDVAINSKDPSILYAAVSTGNNGDNATGIYKSDDGGSSWSLLSNFAHGGNYARMGLAISASNPSVIYAVATGPFPGGLAEMGVSMNGGSTWTNLTNTPDFDPSWTNLAIAVDPSNPAIVYAGGTEVTTNGLIESTDGGANWGSIFWDDTRAYTKSDDHAMVFDANGHLLLGCDGGIYRKDSDPNNANGFLWTDLNGDLNTVLFYSVSMDAETGNILGGPHDIGITLYTSANGTWTSRSGSEDVGRVAFATSTLAYEYDSTNFLISKDGGKTWSDATNGVNLNDPFSFPPAFAVDPNNPDRVILGSNQLYQTIDAASSWTKFTSTGVNGWNPKGNPADAVGLAASDANTIYAATGGETAKSSQIFVSTDGGTTWSERDLPKGSGRINQILVDPTNAQTAYAVINTFGGGHVFKTTDGGKTWTDISGNLPDLPTWSIQLDAPHNVLFIGNDQGVYSSTDGGNTWSRFGSGFPNVRVFSLDYSTERNALLAGTYGRGAWEIPIIFTPPQVTTDPTNQTVAAGQTATFMAAASGYPPPTVQWKVSTDGGKIFSNLSGATSTTLTLINVTFAMNGNEYRAVFTNSEGSATTNVARLTVQTAPLVTSDPSDQTVSAGQTATFTASADGNPAPTVQCQVSSDGGNTFIDITAATSTTLTLSNVQASQNGNEYRAVFTNSVGSATTKAATLNVQTAPLVMTNPSSQTVTAGQTATFTASAGGNPTPTVQWQVSSDGGKTFTDISGATSTTLTLSNVTFAMKSYEYRAVFTNSIGFATTAVAVLTVQTVPLVTTNPSSQTVPVGQTAIFTASAGGNPTPTVQWQVSSDGGKTFTDLSGATSTTLTLNNITLGMNGYEYRAVFTNSAGRATTSAATLNVSTAAGAPIITMNPTNQTVTVGQTATFSASAGDNPPSTVQWQVSSDGGNSFSNLSGATSNTLTLNNVTFAMSGNGYRAVFTNNAGIATTRAATLNVTSAAGAPIITMNPTSQTVTAGQTATFTASASDNPPATVQ